MKNKLVTCIAMLFVVLPVMANGWVNAPIDKVLAHDDGSDNFAGQVHVTMLTNMTAQPSCVTPSNTKRFVIDFSRNASQSQYSMLLAAQVSEKSITVNLNNVCIGGMAKLRNIIVDGN